MNDQPTIRLSTYLFLLLLPLGCGSDDLIDPAPLERELIVVWVALERGDTTVQGQYLARANRNWKQLRRSYRSASVRTDEQGALFLVDLWMIGLRAAVNDGRRADALVHLRQLHRALGVVRLRRGTTHPVDLLYDLRQDWQWVTEISEDQMMCLLDWQEYAEAYYRAAGHWRTYQTSPPSYAGDVLPGLRRHAGRAEMAARALSDELAAFERELLAAHHAPMGRAARAVHDRFIDYLILAIDYPAPGLPPT